MTKNRIRILGWLVGISAAFAAACPDARAQSGGSTVYYLISAPTAGTADFLGDQISFRGIGFESLIQAPGKQMSYGLSFRWVYFRNVDDNATFDTEGGATVNGRLYRAIDSFPIEFLARYQIRDEGPLQAYVGLGIGTIYALRELDIGPVGQSEVGWQFALSPEVGVMIRRGTTGGGVALNLRYEAGFGSDAIDAISHLSLGIGYTSTL